MRTLLLISASNGASDARPGPEGGSREVDYLHIATPLFVCFVA